MLTPKKILKKLKSGYFVTVNKLDADNRVRTEQMRYNPVRHKLYLCEDKRGLHRKHITKKQAIEILHNTFIFESNENT